MPGNPADLHHRLLARESLYDGHLQQHAEGVTNVVGVEFGKALRTIATLQQEAAPLRNFRKIVLERTRFAGENERRIARQRFLDRRQFGCVFIYRQVARFVRI